ncbi:MAG: DUF3524 domain-containing protein [Planctomycetota bacterium]
MMRQLRICALNPFDGGSHRAMLDGWVDHSCHDFTVLRLPGRHWKWRMRHAAASFARELDQRVGERWDVLWTTDMLSLAELRGLAPRHIRELPSVVYFHENQFAYPTQEAADPQRDLHYAMTNVTSALAADVAWFNSAHNRDTFLDGAQDLLSRMPEPTLTGLTDRITSRIEPPGIADELFDAEPSPAAAKRPLHVLWAARWEHDKCPEVFFEGVRRFLQSGRDCRLSVIGQAFREQPAAFETARRDFAPHIDAWGEQPTRAEYLAVLRRSDVFVSAAAHEFFGIAAVEAAACGVVPLVPRRLAYPEVLGPIDRCFHAGTPDTIAAGLATLDDLRRDGAHWASVRQGVSGAVRPYRWSLRAAAMDDAVASLVIERDGEAATPEALPVE